DGGDAAVAQAHISLDDAGVVDDQSVGDDGVHGAVRASRLALAHAVADHLAATELHLLAVGGEVLLDLDDEVRVGQPHLVARGGAEHVGIGGAGDSDGHDRCLLARTTRSYCSWVKPGTCDARSSKVIVVAQPTRRLSSPMSASANSTGCCEQT